MELLPWAMLANGPAWTSAGVFSNVWKRLGLMASFMSTVIAPAALSCSAVMGSRFPFWPMTMRPKRVRMSRRPVVSARIAITSLATVMSKPVSWGRPSPLLPSPATMLRRSRSLMSMTRRQVMLYGLMFSALPW